MSRHVNGPITAVRVQDTINDWREVRRRRGDREDFHREVGKTLDQVLDSKKWGKVSSWPVRYAVSGMNADGEVVADNGAANGGIRVFTEDSLINPATRSVEAAERLNLQALRKQRRLVDAAGKKAQAGKMSWADVDRIRAESGKAYEATRAELAASITNPASRKALAKYHGLMSAGSFDAAAKVYKRIHGGLKGAQKRAGAKRMNPPGPLAFRWFTPEMVARVKQKGWFTPAGHHTGEAARRYRAGYSDGEKGEHPAPNRTEDYAEGYVAGRIAIGRDPLGLLASAKRNPPEGVSILATYGKGDAGQHPILDQALEIAERAKALPVAYVGTRISQLGGAHRAATAISVSLDPRASWSNGIFENSRHARFMVDPVDGAIEMIQGWKVPKFRKARFKSPAEAIAKIAKWAASADAEAPARGNPGRDRYVTPAGKPLPAADLAFIKKCAQAMRPRHALKDTGWEAIAARPAQAAVLLGHKPNVEHAIFAYAAHNSGAHARYGKVPAGYRSQS